MTLPDALSWGASCLSFTSIFFYGRKNVLGPIIGLTSQVPWTVMAWMSGLHGMAFATVVYTTLHVIGLRNLRKA